MQTSLKLTLSLALLVLALATSPALAHKLLVSASPEEGGILTVTAFFPDGAPAQEVPVTAAPADGGAEVQGRTDARGVCRLAGLKPGTYRVAAGDPLGHRAETRVVIPGAAARGDLVGASFAIDAAGLVSGWVSTSEGTTVNFPAGKLSPGKTVLAMAMADNSGGRGLAGGIKNGGNFSSADLRGTWYLTVLADYTGGNSPTWTAVKVTLDSEGSLVDGFFQPSDGAAGVLTDAEFSIEDDGTVSGAVWTESGGIYIEFAKMEASKAIMTGVVSTDTDSRGLAVAVKDATGGAGHGRSR